MVDRLPGEPVPVQFMNTIWADTGGVHDGLDKWVISVIVPGMGTPTVTEFYDARRLRDALRRLAAFTTDDSRPAAQSALESIDDAIAAVNDALRFRAGPRIVLRDDHIHTELVSNASAIRAALADIAEASLTLVGDGTALRACGAPGCVLYFVKTHPRREWCSEGCGNRVRAARHYRRVRAGTTAR
ncbi:CGNR zinc finger domain-containing protein [Actinomycetes bacterium M1A6_2h]